MLAIHLSYTFPIAEREQQFTTVALLAQARNWLGVHFFFAFAFKGEGKKGQEKSKHASLIHTHIIQYNTFILQVSFFRPLTTTHTEPSPDDNSSSCSLLSTHCRACMLAKKQHLSVCTWGDSRWPPSSSVAIVVG